MFIDQHPVKFVDEALRDSLPAGALMLGEFEGDPAAAQELGE
ncbi:hypothetical protein [Harenicola maris]